MKSDAWASYRAAMPPECFGEPDDDLHHDGKPVGPPSQVAVCWMAPETFIDQDGISWTMNAPTGRCFLAGHHNYWPHVMALFNLMERRLGKGRVWIEEYD